MPLSWLYRMLLRLLAAALLFAFGGADRMANAQTVAAVDSEYAMTLDEFVLAFNAAAGGEFYISAEDFSQPTPCGYCDEGRFLERTASVEGLPGALIAAYTRDTGDRLSFVCIGEKLYGSAEHSRMNDAVRAVFLTLNPWYLEEDSEYTVDMDVNAILEGITDTHQSAATIPPGTGIMCVCSRTVLRSDEDGEYYLRVALFDMRIEEATPFDMWDDSFTFPSSQMAWEQCK